MARLYQRNLIYWADLRDEGKGRFTLKTRDKQVAKQRLRDAQLGPSRGGPTPHLGLAVAIDKAIRTKKPGTREAYQNKAALLFRFWPPDTNVNGISRDEVEGYIAGRLEEVKAHTVHKEMVVLRQAIKGAIERGEYYGPAGVVPAFDADYRPRTRHLNTSEFERLMEAAAPSRRIWLVTSVYAGANAGELTHMTKASARTFVDLEQGMITIPGSKTGTRTRTIPINEDLRSWLESVDLKSPLVPRWDNRWRDMTRFCIKAKIEYVNFDDLRRTFASWLKQAGVDSKAVADMMGHKSTYMVDKVYGQLNADAYRRAIAKLPATRRLYSV